MKTIRPATAKKKLLLYIDSYFTIYSIASRPKKNSAESLAQPIQTPTPRLTISRKHTRLCNVLPSLLQICRQYASCRWLTKHPPLPCACPCAFGQVALIFRKTHPRQERTFRQDFSSQCQLQYTQSKGVWPECQSQWVLLQIRRRSPNGCLG